MGVYNWIDVSTNLNLNALGPVLFSQESGPELSCFQPQTDTSKERQTGISSRLLWANILKTRKKSITFLSEWRDSDLELTIEKQSLSVPLTVVSIFSLSNFGNNQLKACRIILPGLLSISAVFAGNGTSSLLASVPFLLNQSSQLLTSLPLLISF